MRVYASCGRCPPPRSKNIYLYESLIDLISWCGHLSLEPLIFVYLYIHLMIARDFCLIGNWFLPSSSATLSHDCQCSRSSIEREFHIASVSSLLSWKQIEKKNAPGSKRLESSKNLLLLFFFRPENHGAISSRSHFHYDETERETSSLGMTKGMNNEPPRTHPFRHLAAPTRAQQRNSMR
jgi:hypothetical protein